jgi:hypothetical protein
MWGSLQCLQICCYFSQTDPNGVFAATFHKQVFCPLALLLFHNLFIDGTLTLCSLYGLGLWPRCTCGLICCMGSVVDPLETRFAYLFQNILISLLTHQNEKIPCNTGYLQCLSAATFLNDPRVPYGVFKIFCYFSQTDNSVGYLTVSSKSSATFLNPFDPRVPYGVSKSTATFHKQIIPLVT